MSKKYFIKVPKGKENIMPLDQPSAWTLSRVVGILSFIATALTFGATYIGQIDPQYAVYALAIAGAINAFTGRVQGNAGK